jgi:hypothetical protein
MHTRLTESFHGALNIEIEERPKSSAGHLKKQNLKSLKSLNKSLLRPATTMRSMVQDENADETYHDLDTFERRVNCRGKSKSTFTSQDWNKFKNFDKTTCKRIKDKKRWNYYNYSTNLCSKLGHKSFSLCAYFPKVMGHHHLSA